MVRSGPYRQAEARHAVLRFGMAWVFVPELLLGVIAASAVWGLYDKARDAPAYSGMAAYASRGEACKGAVWRGLRLRMGEPYGW